MTGRIPISKTYVSKDNWQRFKAGISNTLTFYNDEMVADILIYKQNTEEDFVEVEVKDVNRKK